MAGFASGKVSVENVDLDSSQTLQNKTLDASNDYSGDIINPSRSDVKQDTQANLEVYASGAANGQMCFATDTKQMYQVLDGALAPVGGGSGGLDTFFTDDFEIAGVDDYTSGNDAAFDNGGVLAGTLAVEAVNNISGDQSLKYTQAAGSLNDFIKSPLIPIDKKQQGNTVGLELYYTYNGNDGDLIIVGYDDTGSEVMTIASNTLRAASKAQRFSVQFPVPSGSANLAWGIQVGVENDGAILVIDDVQMSTNPFVSKDLLDEEVILEASDSTTSIPVNVDTKISFNTVDRNKEFIYSLGDITITKDGTYSMSSIVQLPTGGYVGSSYFALRLYKNNAPYGTLDTFPFVNASQENTMSGGISSIEAVAGDVFDVRARHNFGANVVPVSASISFVKTPTATEHIVAYNSRNAENSMVRLHTGNGHGSVNNKIRRFSTEVANLGNAITYADSATDGASFTINENGVYNIRHSDISGSAAINSLGISINSTQLTTNVQSITAADRLDITSMLDSGSAAGTSWSGQLSKGDVIRPHSDGTGSSSTVYCTFTISKIGVGDLLGTPIERIAYVKDVKPSGTQGGTSSALTVQTRDLNTLEGDTEFISLSSNTITLQAGKYEIEAIVPAFRANRHQCFLYNITDSIYVIDGSSAFAASAQDMTTTSSLMSTISITSTKEYEIRHWTESLRSSNGLGLGSDNHVSNPQLGEVYTQVKVVKKA